MIELSLTLMDYFIKLLQKRDDNIDEYFEKYVQPAYEAAELVYSDYLQLMHTIKSKINQNVSPIDLINFLEEGRIKYLPIRARIRAEIMGRYKDAFPPDKDITYSVAEYYRNPRDSVKWENLPDFERGIIGVLMGGLSPFEDAHRIYTPYLRGNHTLLDLLYAFSTYAINDAGENRYSRVINSQLRALEIAWKDVVTGYTKYKILAAPKPAKMKRYKRQGD